MTVLVGLHHPTVGTVIGSDRRVSTGYNHFDFLPTKWIVEHDWAVGCSGHLRTINLVEYHSDELLRNLTGPMDFTIRMMDMLTESKQYIGVAEKGDNVKDYGQCLLLANAKGVWEIGPDFSVCPAPTNHMIATGSGYQYALGCGYATRQVKDPVERVSQAILAATNNDPNCGGEPWVAIMKEAKPPNKRVAR
jgi:hypothetical protein